MISWEVTKEIEAEREELRLLYVAVTRAQMALDVQSIALLLRDGLEAVPAASGDCSELLAALDEYIAQAAIEEATF